MHEALIVVDMQYDFLPGGALAITGGDEIIKPIIAIMPKFQTIVFTQDWHSRGHKSFASSYDKKNPFDVILMHGHEQVLWPDHCVQGSPGAQIHSAFPLDMACMILRKGMDPNVDSYSAFHENWGPNVGGQGYSRKPTGLLEFILSRGVRKVTIVGLARDYCVKWTAEDCGMVLPTEVIWEMTRAVDDSKESNERVRHDLGKKSVMVV